MFAPQTTCATLPRVTLVLYRRRAFTTKLEVRRGDVARVRYSRQKEAARGCGGGRGELWEFNRFLPEKPCQTLAVLMLLRPFPQRNRTPIFLF